tara:strand:- start:42 stop:149 length:108 start_codon:yes stop_codon:yes gene_type:complete
MPVPVTPDTVVVAEVAPAAIVELVALILADVSGGR